MTLYALVSAGGSPGVTTAALALSLGWPGQVILAECDPSGGDILAGLFAGHMPARNGLLALAIEAGQNPDAAAAALWPQLIELDDERGRLLLAGMSDPRQGTALAPVWPVLAATLAAQPADVIADCGRLDAGGGPGAGAGRGQPGGAGPAPDAAPGQQGQGQDRDADPAARRHQPAGPAADRRGDPHRRVRSPGPWASRWPARCRTTRRPPSVLSDGVGSRRGLQARPLIRAAGPAGRALREAAPGSPGRTAAPGPAAREASTSR